LSKKPLLHKLSQEQLNAQTPLRLLFQKKIHGGLSKNGFRRCVGRQDTESKVYAIKDAHIRADGGIDKGHALQIVGANVECESKQQNRENLMLISRIVLDWVDAAEQLLLRELAEVLFIASPQRSPKHSQMAALGDLRQAFCRLSIASRRIGDCKPIHVVESEVDEWRKPLQLVVGRLVG
jgi:hypothetical protein